VETNLLHLPGIVKHMEIYTAPILIQFGKLRVNNTATLGDNLSPAMNKFRE